MALQERGFAQTIRVPSYGGGVWPNCHLTFIVAENFYSQILLLYLRYLRGEGVGWIRHIVERGLV